MIPTQIQGNIVRVDTPAVFAFYIVKSSDLFPLALVCDDNDVLVGVIGNKEIDPWGLFRADIPSKSCGEICARSFTFMEAADEYSLYRGARNIFAEKALMTLPIVDEKGTPIRLFGRFQAFFREMYNCLPYNNYAYGLFDAASMAKSRGYDRISAIEFGVAGGRGLSHMELYAREVSRLCGLTIDIYGFDSGIGLFPPADYRDCSQTWIEGDYKMDFELLQKRLYHAKLVIGNICETTKTFFNDYTPPPIGFISVDVDQYTPTVAILEMLLEDDRNFLPIITMYFDDIHPILEFQGEALAIREFNEKNEHLKITPEHRPFNYYLRNPVSYTAEFIGQNSTVQLKWCNRFNHPSFATPRTNLQKLTI